MVSMMKSLLVSTASAAFALLACLPAVAEELPSSVTYDHSTVRLLTGKSDGATWDAGLEISMRPGWKTYWRVPGDAGVPPAFDWTKSENLKRVDVSWPAPKRYRDEAGESIGYKDQVVFPMQVTPKDATKPVKLVLDLFYAVCKDICIPGMAKLSATLDDPAGNQYDTALIEDYRSRVPASSGQRLQLESVGVRDYEGGLVLAVTLKGDGSASKADIFVEGAEELYFRKPEEMTAESDGRMFYLKVDGAKSATELKGKKVTLTIVDEAGAVSRPVTIK